MAMREVTLQLKLHYTTKPKDLKGTRVYFWDKQRAKIVGEAEIVGDEYEVQAER